MMTSHKDFSLDNLVGGSVMDDGVPGELLATAGTPKITFCIILYYPVSKTLYECSGTLLFVAIKQIGAFSAVHSDCVCFFHSFLFKMTF